MKHFHKQLLSTGLLLMAGNICFGVGIETDVEKSFQPSEWEAASDESLDTMRGGFDIASGLTVSFGFVRTISINGDLVNTTSFNLPDVTKITAAQAQVVTAAIAQAGIIQIGSNNFVDTSGTSQIGTSTIVQNTLNDQKIQSLTVVNTAVNSLNLLKSINSQTVLKDALLGSLGLK